jgi:NDP-sugar pyrophosphorylase family protein
MIKQAIISAGGFGTRLRPYTDTVPKPMLPVLGKPVLEWSIEHFKKYGVGEFFITLHYLPEVVMDYFGDGSKFGAKIHYFFEEKPLGEAGAIKKFEAELNQLFYYIYGDMLTLVDYRKMAAAYAIKSSQDERTIGMERIERRDDYADTDVVELDADGRFIAVHPKPHAQKYVNAYRTRGSFIFDKRILSYIPDSQPFTLNRQLIPAAIAAGEHFYAYECKDYSKAFDTIEKWHEVEEYLKTHTIK